MAGMYKSRDIVFPGQVILGTKGPRKFLRGHIVSGRSTTPPVGEVIMFTGVNNSMPLLFTGALTGATGGRLLGRMHHQLQQG